MSKFGEKLIRAAKQGRAIARGEADPSTYRIYEPKAISREVKAGTLKLGAKPGKKANPRTTTRRVDP